MTLQKLSQNIIERNAMLRANRRKSGRVIEIAVCYLPTHQNDVSGYRSRVKSTYESLYGFDMLPFILSIVINIVVKLILQWWFSSQDINTLRAMKAECQPQLQNLNPL